MKLRTELSELQEFFDLVTEDLDSVLKISFVALLNAAYHIGKADEAVEMSEKMGARP